MQWIDFICMKHHCMKHLWDFKNLKFIEPIMNLCNSMILE